MTIRNGQQRNLVHVLVPQGCKYGDSCYFKHDSEDKGTGVVAVEIPFAVPGVVAISSSHHTEQIRFGSAAETWQSLSGQVALVATSHIEANHPKAIDCDTCDRTRLKEAPAKKGKKDEEKIIVNKF